MLKLARLAHSDRRIVSCCSQIDGSLPCPVLHELSCTHCLVMQYCQLRRVLVMAEMLAEAGYRPSIYKNVMTASGSVLPVYDPLKEAHDTEFELDFSNR